MYALPLVLTRGIQSMHVGFWFGIFGFIWKILLFNITCLSDSRERGGWGI